ncbi:uncharacterized protein METZ01_LOCUS208118, partial [marine metagenome]
VILGKLLGLNLQPAILSQLVQLALHFLHRDDRVERAQRKQNRLILCLRGQFPHRLLRLVNITTDPNAPGQLVRVAHRDFHRYQAALAEAELKSLPRRKTGLALGIKQSKQCLTAAFHTRRRVIREIIP